jgi:mannan endo-1,4-beta-mannosidase
MAANVPTPANANATGAAVELLRFISSLPERPDARVLSGQFIRWCHNASLEEIEGVRRATGHWLAIASGDYYTNDQQRGHPIDCARTNRVLAEYAKRGGIVSLSIHANNSATGGPAWDTSQGLDWVDDPANEAHANWTRQLGQVADGLAELANQGIPVLFRPLHEMNGGWFWWGKGRPERYTTLWRDMFAYMTHERGLDNLLWVYSPSAQSDQLRYYPGSDVVDVVGFDAYTADLPSDARLAYEQLVSTGKPFGIAEYGPCGPESLPEPFDYSRLIDWIRLDFPQTAFFIAWRDHWGLNRNANVKQLLDDPWVLNLDGLKDRKPTP